MSDDITVKGVGTGPVCRECGSELPQHFGSCSQHPTNMALVGRKVEEHEYKDSIATRPEPPQTYPVNEWLKGSEMKVTEDFLKIAIGNHTGSKVKSVKYKGKSFVVVFE